MNATPVSGESSDGFQALLALSGDPALLLDAQGRVLYCNGRLPEWLQGEALSGKLLSHSVVCADQERFAKWLLHALLQRAVCTLSFVDSTRFPQSVLLLGSPTHFQNQAAVAMVVQRVPGAALPDEARSTELAGAIRQAEFQRTVFQVSPVAVAVSRLADGVLVDANEAFVALHGYSRSELLGHTSAELKLWEASVDRDGVMERLKAHGRVDGLPVTYRTRSGEIGMWLASVRLVAIHGETYVVGSLTEYTDIHNAHELMLESKSRYKLLSEATFEGVAVIQGRTLVETNEQLAHLLGYTREEMLGKQIDVAFVAPESMEKARLQVQRGGDSFNEYVFMRKGGERIQVEVRSREVDIGGEQHRLSAIRDVTERNASRAALMDLHERYQSLFQSNVIGVAVGSVSGQLLEANDYLLRAIGFSREQQQAFTLYWTDATAPWSREADQHAISQVHLHGRCPAFEKDYLHRDGTIVSALVTLIRLPGDDEKILCVMVNVSPLRTVQKELNQANEALRKQTAEARAATEAKTRFLSTISHELRTPLHTILGNVSVLRKESRPGVDATLLVVEKSGNALLRLIDELLEFNLDSTQPDALQPDWMEVGYLSAEISNFGRIAAGSGENQFTMLVGRDVPRQLMVDERRLQQVLQNLVGNACKYTQRGHIAVRIERLPTAPAAGDRLMQTIRFSVQDTGRGIAPDELDRIFEPLFRGTGTSDQGGVGLGLAIASQWVRNMGGNIHVQSTPGHGSLFRFELLLEASADCGWADTAAAEAVLRCNAYMPVLQNAAAQVLIVDDGAESQMVVADMCASFGYQVLQATDCESALARCRAMQQPALAVLVDQYMPGLDGWDFLQRVRNIPGWEMIPMVLVSAAAANRPVGCPTDLHFDLVLTKPLDEMTLKCFLCHGLSGVSRTPQNCWHERRIPVELPVVPLPHEQLLQLADLLIMGRLVRVVEWARELQRDPRYADLARTLANLAEAADLPALEKLLSGWQSRVRDDKQKGEL